MDLIDGKAHLDVENDERRFVCTWHGYRIKVDDSCALAACRLGNRYRGKIFLLVSILGMDAPLPVKVWVELPNPRQLEAHLNSRLSAPSTFTVFLKKIYDEKNIYVSCCLQNLEEISSAPSYLTKNFAVFGKWNSPLGRNGATTLWISNHCHRDIMGHTIPPYERYRGRRNATQI